MWSRRSRQTRGLPPLQPVPMPLLIRKTRVWCRASECGLVGGARQYSKSVNNPITRGRDAVTHIIATSDGPAVLDGHKPSSIFQHRHTHPPTHILAWFTASLRPANLSVPTLSSPPSPSSIFPLRPTADVRLGAGGSRASPVHVSAEEHQRSKPCSISSPVGLPEGEAGVGLERPERKWQLHGLGCFNSAR